MTGDRRVRPEAPLPQPIGDHDHARRLGIVVRGSEHPPEQRLYPHDREVLLGHLYALDTFRCVAAGDVDLDRIEERHLVEDVSLLPPVSVVGVRNAAASYLARLIHADGHDQLRTVRDTHRPVEHGIDRAEDGDGPPDPERERQDRDEGERRASAQHAHGVAHVLRRVGEPRATRLGAWRIDGGRRGQGAPKLLTHADVFAQFRDRRACRLLVTAAHGSHLGIPILEMLFEFLRDFRFTRGVEIRGRQSSCDLLAPA